MTIIAMATVVMDQIMEADMVAVVDMEAVADMEAVVDMEAVAGTVVDMDPVADTVVDMDPVDMDTMISKKKIKIIFFHNCKYYYSRDLINK